MNTLPLHASHAPHGWSLPSLSRIGSYLSLLLDAYHEAQLQTLVARRKYPFADV